MVKRVQEMFKKDGADATFKAVSDPSTKEFHDRDLYVFIYDMSGVCVAHGARPALIGKNLIDIKDQDGKYLIREMVEIAKGAGQRLGRLQVAKSADQQDRRQVELYRKDGRLFRRRRGLSAMTSADGAVTPPERARPRQASPRVRPFLASSIICPIQIKASTASAVLLICLLGLGANAYLTSTRTADRTAVAVERSHTEAAGILQRERGCRCDAHENLSLRLLGQQWRQR